MSDTYLVIALVGTPLAIMLAGLAMDLSLAERRRLRVLATRVGSVAESGPSLREDDLERSFGRRALLPFVSGAGRLARKVTGLETRDRLARKLVLAGSPVGWDAERVGAFKVLAGICGLAAGLLVGTLIGVGPLPFVALTALLAVVGFFGPDAALDRRVKARQQEIRRSLPDVLDLLTISVEAGLALNAGLAQVVKNDTGALGQEIARMLQEIQLGTSRADAFRHLAERTDVDELNSFVLAMTQADAYGISIANVLRAQAREQRVKRRQRAEGEAQRTPVKIVFPLIFCVLPALFVVIIGPGAIRIFENVLSR